MLSCILTVWLCLPLLRSSAFDSASLQFSDVRKVFELFDATQEGVVRVSALRDMFQHLSLNPDEEAVTRIIAELGANSDLIQLDDLISALSDKIVDLPTSFRSIQSFVHMLAAQMTDEQIDAMIDQVKEENEEAEMSFDEFVQILKP